MSTMSFAKQAYSVFNREKPHSSISEWVEILTSSSYDGEAYDGIPELVESINIQATGPAEASRALRKKIKHGNPHQQYRALHILKAIVENGGHKFQTSFADTMLTDALKHLASDPSTDPRVKKKLASVLAAWKRQFSDDPSMIDVARLFDQCKLAQSDRAAQDKKVIEHVNLGLGIDVEYVERKSREEEARKKREAEKRKTKEDKEKRKREEAERKHKPAQPRTKRKPFNFEEEKPQILTAIASASQVTNNLVNAMTLVNTQQERLDENERVQECLAKVKQVRKHIVRYVQLVENEDMIGVLIDTNDRIISALENYDAASKFYLSKLSKPGTSEQQVKEIQEGLAAAKLSTKKQRAAIERFRRDEPTSPSYVHPDLQDLQFGSLGADQRNLPPPIRPTTARSSDEDDEYRRGSLSDYSDYESSDEATHNRAGPSSGTRRGYVDVSDDEPRTEVEDPFADPFAD
ncbi:uncharacterized protein BXZ73DRAFT_87198 [Epithele typhae]|uniref:uncharacterized protein n=1 Tax=Epithele typhae TaxID=378194 RepID=UPI0020088210|nr:uncharacterized protein BXZ73DRAFT_87198 [Epithele typhae]KAH9944270.1 hypothetical protein BXZ73DRAFT_87198 [Epithele typhae]